MLLFKIIIYLFFFLRFWPTVEHVKQLLHDFSSFLAYPNMLSSFHYVHFSFIPSDNFYLSLLVLLKTHNVFNLFLTTSLSKILSFGSSNFVRSFITSVNQRICVLGLLSEQSNILLVSHSV